MVHIKQLYKFYILFDEAYGGDARVERDAQVFRLSEKRKKRLTDFQKCLFSGSCVETRTDHATAAEVACLAHPRKLHLF